jgi:L-lactate dehydrogenase complex protein LldG
VSAPGESDPSLDPSLEARAGLWERFAAKAAAVGAVTERAAGERQAAGRIARSTAAAVATPGLTARFPRIAAACSGGEAGERGEGGAGEREGARPAGGDVVAPGHFAVAETGSVAVGEDNPGRAACFLAERLWLVVGAGAVVPTLELALDRLAALIRGGAPYATLMTGPSRTADIERTVTVGVHGPRALTILVVEDVEDGEGIEEGVEEIGDEAGGAGMGRAEVRA